jgi:3',5'-cyclic AMP phosphodiesterase CpdA
LILPAVLMLAMFAFRHVRADDAAEEESFTVVLLPDTQFYSEKHPDTYVAQTLWIRQRLKQDNIKFAVHLGDIVQTSTKEPEWVNANRAMEILDGVLPYSVVPGNHDMQVKTRNTELYNKYFSPARFKDRKWYGGHLGEANDNNYCYFEACGRKFLVISLEFAPRDAALEWATEVAAKHPEHHVIVATHCYMRIKERDTSCADSYKTEGNSGEEMWQKFVKKSPNVFLVVSGHVAGVGLQTSTNDAGRKVVEMLTDYQNLANGGDGWLRTLRFEPAAGKIHVRTYSPLLDKENTDANQTFTIDCELRPALRKAG